MSAQFDELRTAERQVDNPLGLTVHFKQKRSYDYSFFEVVSVACNFAGRELYMHSRRIATRSSI